MTEKPTYDLSLLKVVIIDDSHHMLRIVRTLLQTMNMRNVFSVDNPDDALREMAEQKPDLIIVDWNMFPFDGLDSSAASTARPASGLRMGIEARAMAARIDKDGIDRDGEA